jgi:hypothetical protein
MAAPVLMPSDGAEQGAATACACPWRLEAFCLPSAVFEYVGKRSPN